MTNELSDYMTLFAGGQRSHGTYEVQTRAASGKLEGKGLTRRSPPTEELYRKHLNKELPLGVVPIREDSTCVFAAIDVDLYTNTYMPLVEKVQELNLPLVPCLSKSGGLHLYLFFAEPVACAIVRAALERIAEALGVPGVEVFPKQDELRGDDDLGSWLNLPYFGGLVGPVEAERLFVDPRSGEKVADLQRFLQVATALRITAAQLDATVARLQSPAEALFSDGPPCLQRLAMRRADEGGRNNTLYQCGVYLRKKHGNDPVFDQVFVLEQLSKYNDTVLAAPLSASEVSAIAKSMTRKKEYQYKCKEPPFKAACNKSLCLRRPLGVGQPRTEYVVHFGPMTVFRVQDRAGRVVGDPWYQWTLNGVPVKFQFAELKQSKFRDRVQANFNFIPGRMDDDEWDEFVSDALQKATVVAEPFEASAIGQLVGHVRDFARDFGQRRTWDAILEGDVYVDRHTMRAAFRWQDLQRYLERKNVRGFKPSEVWDTLKQFLDGKAKETTLYGKHLRYWDIQLQEQDLMVPDDVAPEF